MDAIDDDLPAMQDIFNGHYDVLQEGPDFTVPYLITRQVSESLLFNITSQLEHVTVSTPKDFMYDNPYYHRKNQLIKEIIIL